MLERFERNVTAYGLPYFGSFHPQQVIMHAVAPELPSLMIVGADPRRIGCLAFGVGAQDALHVLATQALWMRKPKIMRISVEDELSRHVTAKDLVLTLITRIGAEAAIGHIIEFAGSAVCAMSMEGRMTLCNMAVEAGALSGLVSPGQITFDYPVPPVLAKFLPTASKTAYCPWCLTKRSVPESANNCTPVQAQK